MKKITILAAIVALLGSCAQNTEDTINPNTKAEGRTIYATFDNEEEETKTYVENYKYLRWHAGDEISFFDATTHNSQYAFAGNDGDAEGEFNAVATGEGTAIATTYGVYPYNANTSISEEGVISVELPAIQAYGVNSFGKGANTMVAVGESATDDKLFFKNACGYLVVKLYNESGATVKSVVLKGNKDERIAGAATITATHAGVPSVAMADTATTSVTIDCGEGVEIGTTAETATEFWFALPETTFEGGITITATDTEGKEYEKTTTKPVAITRNNVQPMAALNCDFVVPDTWKIYYTASSKVTPYNKNVFGASIVSNEWDSTTGEGVITFNGEVTSIGKYAFYGCEITSITILDSVIEIGENAFRWCSSLTSITIPDSVISIGNCAFQSCLSLTSVTIGNGVISIGDDAFDDCSSLTSITIPDSVISIGNCAFQSCLNLTSVTIGNGVISIGNHAFSSCSSLASITIPDSVTSIGNGAFIGCSSLASITISDGVTSIGSQAFRDCSSLASVTIPEGVTSIGDRVFYGCSNLSSITIPDSVTSMGNYAFSSCSSLASVTIPKSITSIGNYAFAWCSSLTSITIPNSVTSIGDRVFYGCSNLSSITIPDSTTSIGECAFGFCEKLTQITIPKKVEEIDYYAFGSCSSLVKVYCEPTTPPSGVSGMFDGNASERKIYVPAESVEAYKTAEGWSEYADSIYGYDF